MQLPPREPLPMEAGGEVAAGVMGGCLCDTHRYWPARGDDRTPLGLPPESRSARGRHKAESSQDGAAEPFGSSDPLFDFFSVPIPAAPVLGAAQSPLQVPAGVLL